MMRRLIHSIKSGPGYEPEYLAVLAQATALGYTLPSTSQSNLNNKKIKYLKDEGIWNALSVLWFAKQESGLEDFATLNWVNPTQFQLNQSNGSLKPSFVAGNGFRGGNGSGIKYFFTNYFLSTDTNIGLNNISVFFKSFDVPSPYAEQTYFVGARNSNNGGQLFVADQSNSQNDFRLFSTSQTPTLQNDENKHRFILRTNSSSYNTYQEGLFLVNTSITGTGTITTRELLFLGMNNNGSLLGTNSNGGLSYLALANSVDLIGKQVEIYEIMEELYTP